MFTSETMACLTVGSIPLTSFFLLFGGLNSFGRFQKKKQKQIRMVNRSPEALRNFYISHRYSILKQFTTPFFRRRKKHKID